MLLPGIPVKKVYKVSKKEEKLIDRLIELKLTNNEEEAIRKISNNKRRIKSHILQFGLDQEEIDKFRSNIRIPYTKKYSAQLLKKITEIIGNPDYFDGYCSNGHDYDYRVFSKVEKLIKKGADVSGKSGIDLLNFCIKNQYNNTAVLLIKGGVNIESDDETMSSSLKTSIENNNTTSLILLIGLGINLNKKDENNKSVIELAEEYCDSDFCEILYLNGALKEKINVTQTKKEEEKNIDNQIGLLFEEAINRMNEINSAPKTKVLK